MRKSIHLEDIPYRPDSCALFARLRDLPYAALLDSSYPATRRGRYDILTAQPMADQPPALAAAATREQVLAHFGDLRRFHREYFGGIQPVSHDIPFSGGLLGYLSYDLGNRLHDVALPEAPAGSLSGLRAYDWCVVQDHLLQRSALVTMPGLPKKRLHALRAQLREPAVTGDQPFTLKEKFRGTYTPDDYRQAFDKIQAYIHAGDCYQVNLAQHFSAPFTGDPFHAYQQLRAAAAAPFSAYLEQPSGHALLCLSPERFLQLYGHRVETSPIKGTRPRSNDPHTDKLSARELGNAAKDRAENLMIVDLLRNDLGRNCVPGSIHVDKLFEVQSFSTVHHMVSTISGELQRDSSAWELLRDSFPGGSITGAPKRRAMQIIAEVEPRARGPYCGSVMYIAADGRMDSNIAIRSLLCSADSIDCWAGGGIVADSDWQSELQETYDKVGRFLRLLESSVHN